MISADNRSVGKLDPTKPCLVLAPHLEYPTRDGGSILIDRKYAHFSEHIPFVDLIGKNNIVRYQNGKPVKSTRYENVHVGKTAAAVATLRKRSHYLHEKFVTRSFEKIAQARFTNIDYGTIVFSFIWTAAVLRTLPTAKNKLYCIETHNDEFKWYEDIRRTSINPFAKLVAYFSEKWAHCFLDEHDSDFLFLHVSEADRRGFLRRFPDHRGYVVPIGVDLVPDESFCSGSPVASAKARLIFVGSLGVKINLDALESFKRTFYPTLKEELEEELEVLIVGSNPSRKITRLCRDMGWKLYPNVSDRELRNLYNISTFSILPFSYTTGSKLKLLNSLAHGVPYMATSQLRDQVEEVIYPCLVSSDPKKWTERIRDVRRRGITGEERTLLKNYARNHSWKSVAHRMFELLNQEGQSINYT